MQETQTEKKHHSHMPSAFTILSLIIILVTILTWIIPAGTYETDKVENIIPDTYKAVTNEPQRVWDVFMVPVIGVVGGKKADGAISVSLFILVIGGFLGVVSKANASSEGIGSIVRRYKGREKQLTPILMLLSIPGRSTYGTGEETIASYPLLIPVMIGVGFDSIAVVAIALVENQVGCLVSTVSPFAIGVAPQTLNISFGNGLVSRVILLIIVVMISIIYVYRYASVTEKDPTKLLVCNQ